MEENRIRINEKWIYDSMGGILLRSKDFVKGVAKHSYQGTLISTIITNIECKSKFKMQNKIDLMIKKHGVNAAPFIEDSILRYSRLPFRIYRHLPKELIRDFSQIITLRRLNCDIDPDLYQNLMTKINLLQPALLTTIIWNNLCYISIINGLFKIGWLFRKKAIDSAYLYASNTKANLNNLLDGFKAAMDQADYDEASDLITKISARSKNKYDNDKLRIFYFLLTGELDCAHSIALKYYQGIDHKYAAYLEDKTVAIVGPAPTNEDVAEEIDSFDVVIRVSFIKGNIPDPKQFGSKTHVSQYGTGFSKLLNQGSDNGFLNDLDFVSFKSLEYNFQKELINSNRGRLLISPNNYLYYGNANEIQLILYDLIHFNPSSIKVFKTNLYLSPKPYYKGYNSIENKKQLWLGFAHHNAITQLNFTRNLWKANLVEVDESLKSVLRLTEYEYISSLEQIYAGK